MTIFLILLCLVLGSCDLFVTDLETFFEEQTGGIAVGEAQSDAGKMALGTDGYVCLEAGETGFSIPIDNPLGYALRVESSFTPTFGGIDGVTVSAAGTGRLAVSVPPGQTAGNEGILHIKVMTAKEGRVLYEGDTGIAYLDFLDFTTHLSVELSHSLVLTPLFDPAVPNYSISNAPDSFSIRAVAVADVSDTGPLSPLITIDGMSDRGVLVRNITPAAGGSTVTMRVELPHGAAARTWSIEVHPAGYSGAALVVAHAPATTVFKVGDTLTSAGLIADGLEMNYVTGEGWSPVDLTLCTIDCDPGTEGLQTTFTTPGTKTVAVTYTNPATDFDVIGSFTAYVVGLTALTVTSPTGPQTAPLFDAPGSYTLTSVPFGADTLSVNAVSAVAGVQGAKLRIKRTYPSTAGGDVVSGVTSVIPLITGTKGTAAVGNTVTIEVELDRTALGSNAVTETWTLAITRATLNTEEEFYVAGPAETLAPGRNPGSDTGMGTEEAPYATVKKALDLVKASGLGGVPGAEFTIIVSGTVTDDTGSGSNGMVEIGAGYPEIILEGIDAGTNVIKASGKRVLHVSNGAKVTLEAGLTLTGGATSGGGYVSGGGGVYVTGSGSAFTMTGGFIKNNTASNNGGGVYVYTGGAFTMTGGVIHNNTAYSGGGVSVYSGGTFTMKEDAVIRDNDSSAGGGGVSVYGDGIFDMTGGVIEGNGTTANGGHGVYITGTGKFTMGGDAVIQHNPGPSNGGNVSGGGVSISGSSTVFTMKENAVIQHNTAYLGGGVDVSGGTFTMNGNAVMYDNTASSGPGGGVYVSGSNSSFTMKENAVIKENTASSGGGGVYVYNGGTFDMTGGVIEGNENTSAYPNYGGGGVYVTGSNSAFTMTGGLIKGNKAMSSHGGGVHVSVTSFTMTGGVIEGNEAANGGGVYVDGSSNSAFIKTGGTVYGSNIASQGKAVYLNGGKKRDTTVGTDATGRLYAKYASGWSYVNPDGAEDTGPNWDLP